MTHKSILFDWNIVGPAMEIRQKASTRADDQDPVMLSLWLAPR